MVKLNVKDQTSSYDIDIKHPEIIIVKNFISELEQKQILNLLNSLKEEQWTDYFISDVKQRAKILFNEEDYEKLIRQKKIHINADLKDRMAHIDIKDYKDNWFEKILSFFSNSEKIMDLRGSLEIMARMYPGSKFNYHNDSGHFDNNSDSNAKYTAIIYYNDNYHGGELDFPDHKIKFQPPARSLVIFNSSFTHGVTPVLEGPTRYCSNMLIKVKGD